MSGKRIGVVGAGAWGLALALAAHRAGAEVRLWGRDTTDLTATRRSARLPDVALPAEIEIAATLAELADCTALLVATPAQASRQMAMDLAAALTPRSLILCAKGVDLASGRFLSEVVAEAAPGFALAILSGPSFAADVAAGLPTAVTLAAHDAALAAELGDRLQGPNFRLYDSDDVRGVEIGGAAKNVLAIACGAAAGMGLGASAGAALAARGFAEIQRFGAAYGARPATLMGLSGLGDLLLTCASPQSRNFAFGQALGRGEAPQRQLAEGALTAPALVALASARGIDMPICKAVAALVAGETTARQAVEALLARPRKSEA
jgi:glycerol-3-phosphate dehydrogenase (NAD(P)+)